MKVSSNINVNALRHCKTLNRFVLVRLYVFSIYGRQYTHRFLFKGCEYCGNGCSCSGDCVVGQEWNVRIGTPRYEPRYYKYPGPVMLKRRMEGANLRH